jgi:hypothetical protein
MTTTAFSKALQASRPAPQYKAKLMLYGQFVGSWEAEANWLLPDGTTRPHYWQVHFAWVLEGRAIQDVWMTPPREGSRSNEHPEPWGKFGNQYGTTLRVCDPEIDAWHITYIEPYSSSRATLIGRPHQDEIFQEGSGSDGLLLRWIFSDISAEAFRWHAEVSRDEGVTWRKALEMLARRCNER